MTDTLTIPNIDLEKMLGHELCCEGLLYKSETIPCDNKATWRRVWCHGCTVVPRIGFKCDGCHLTIIQNQLFIFRINGFVRCRYCKFQTDDLNEYNRFIRL